MSIWAPIALCFLLFIILFIVFAAAVPGMKIRTELWATLIGLLAVLPVAFTEYVVLNLPIFTSNSFISVIVTALIFNGLIEESLKMIGMFLLPAKKLTISTFFCSCILCGLAFGSFESVIYMLVFLQKNTGTGTEAIFNLVLARLCTAVLIHTFCAGLSGLYIWTFKKKKVKVAPFIWAVILHGLYNFFASYPKPFYYFIIPVILFAAVECRIRYQSISEYKSEN